MTRMDCRKRGLHLEGDCQSKPERNGYKRLRSGLLNTRERDAPVAQRAIMKRNSTTSRLLSLPPEIQNRIYNLVLGGERLAISYEPHQRKYKQIDYCRYRVHVGGGLYHHLSLNGYRRGARRTLHLGLVRVCRQIYGETALLPYALNEFAFENGWVRRKFWKEIKPAQQRAVGKYKIGISYT
ncbi:hypothetical protein BDR22DRAFT_839596 [Usnea florida]